MNRNSVTRVVASAFILAGSVALGVDLWPDEGEESVLRSGLAVLTVIVGTITIYSLWKR